MCRRKEVLLNFELKIIFKVLFLVGLHAIEPGIEFPLDFSLNQEKISAPLLLR